jgi:hypothetical protein
MQNLFSIALALKTSTTPFSYMSRRFRHFKDVDPSMYPAFFQFQAPTRNTSGGVRKIPKEEIGVSWFVYLPGSQSFDDVVSPALNNYYDALSDALLTTLIVPGNPATVLLNGQRAGSGQTLGGLVTQCYKDGDGLTDEGLLDTPSLIHIPIKILVGI